MNVERLLRPARPLECGLIAVLLLFGAPSCTDPVAPADERHDRLLFLSDRDAPPTQAINPYVDLYRMNADGSGVENVTRDAAQYRLMSLSPDGRRLAVYRVRAACQGIWAFDTDGAGREQLTNRGDNAGADRCNYHPRWSPDGTRIAFATTRDATTTGPAWAVYVMNADGSDPRNVSRPIGEGVDREIGFGYARPVSWSPDGTLAFDFYHMIRDVPGFTVRSYLVNAAGSGLRPLFEQVDDFAPHWSPDGTKIVFLRREADTQTLFLTNADGSAVRRLSDEPGRHGLPSASIAVARNASDYSPWSPDGRSIAFEVMTADGRAIHVIGADGTGARRITPPAMNAWFGGWSPRGDRIAFASNDDVHIVNVDGTGLVNLTNSAAREHDVMWLPAR